MCSPDSHHRFGLHWPNRALRLPVHVRLSENIPKFTYSSFVSSSAADLYFADEQGHPLPHEIDSWNPDGESLVWVRLPSLSQNTTVFADYGSENHSTGNGTRFLHCAGDSEIPLPGINAIQGTAAQFYRAPENGDDRPSTLSLLRDAGLNSAVESATDLWGKIASSQISSISAATNSIPDLPSSSYANGAHDCTRLSSAHTRKGREPRPSLCSLSYPTGRALRPRPVG